MANIFALEGVEDFDLGGVNIFALADAWL